MSTFWFIRLKHYVIDKNNNSLKFFVHCLIHGYLTFFVTFVVSKMNPLPVSGSWRLWLPPPPSPLIFDFRRSALPFDRRKFRAEPESKGSTSSSLEEDYSSRSSSLWRRNGEIPVARGRSTRSIWLRPESIYFLNMFFQLSSSPNKPSSRPSIPIVSKYPTAAAVASLKLRSIKGQDHALTRYWKLK